MEPKEQVRERIDVADLVGEYLQLKGAGQGSFKAVCPFHSEKTPSFYVSRPKQIWHCFGCDKGGDIFAFVMEMEGVEFREALEILAGKAGVELPKYQGKQDDGKARMKSINAFAEAVYGKFLTTGGGKVARDYLEKRGIPESLVTAFGLGYAPEGWTHLVDMAKKKGISGSELKDAGLALPSKGSSGVIDRFRHRLMIPLRDHHGNTVGFTGRVLNPEDSPKYMNSPQTAVYDKSALLYGLDLAKTAIKHEGAVVIVEGNLDVVASHKADVKHVVASSGTALTDRQLRLVKRYTTKLIFAFDADNAGFEAARRGMRLASQMGFDVRVAPIPPELGKDPDDLVQKDPASWRNVVENHVDKMAFFFDRMVASIDRSDVQAKKAAGQAFLPEVKSLKDAIERDHWVTRFADHLGIDRATVERALTGTQAPKEERFTPENTSEDVPEEAPAFAHDATLDLLFSLGFAEKETRKVFFETFSQELLVDGPYADLYKLAKNLYTDPNHRPQNKSFFEVLRSYLGQQQADLVPFLDAIALVQDRYEDRQTSPSGDTVSALTSLIDRYKDQSRKQQRRVLLQQLRQAEASGDKERVAELTRTLQSLIS